MGNSSSLLYEAVTSLIPALMKTVGTSVQALLDTFMEKPEGANYTMQAIQKIIERQQRDLEHREAEERKRAQEREADMQHGDVVLSAAKQYHEEALQKSVEVALQVEAAAKMREEAVLEMEAIARMREEAALVETEKAKEALWQGIRPVVVPTLEQFNDAKKRIQYDPEKLHFAVCGTSGSGKSTVINAVRGLGGDGDGAACVGVTECTSEITRYRDLRKETPYSRFVWYDIPGAGTTEVPDWQYFNDQGLFVFDFIIMVYDVRFTKIDEGIIENCYRFKIPVFIVRSKADQHITNMMQEKGCGHGDDDYGELYRETVKQYDEATRLDFDKHMQKMADVPELDARDRQMLWGQRVYIVAAATLRGLLETTTTGTKPKRAVDMGKIIDEGLLVEDMLRAAARRRYSTKNVS